jgi:hypothetical protein
MSTIDMFAADNEVVVTITETLSRPLTPTQRKFNAHIKKIEQQKKLLAQWQTTSDTCQQDVNKKLLPLQRVFAVHQADMVDALEQAYNTQKLTKAQKGKISHLISTLCVELIDHGRDEFKDIYNRYQDDDDKDFDEEERIQTEILKAMLEDEFGVQFDDDFDITNPEVFAQKIFEQQEAIQQEAEQNRAQRRKTAKQLAKEAKEQEEQASISKSIQAVYRQLVGALHPDREPDANERERKTALMQEVTVAYEKKNLLKLLELQLSVEQIDQDSIYNMAEDRLKHFIKVLDTQYHELKEEVQEIELRYRTMLGIPYYETLTPKRLTQLLKDDIRRLEYKNKQLAEDVRLFQQDPSYLKLWLRDYQI